VALVGNASHTLHPVAGQGFNLGLRDGLTLAPILIDASRAGADPGERAVLDRYAQARKADHHRIITATDGLARLFTLPGQPARVARSLGLLALDLLPPAKAVLARYAMGAGLQLPVSEDAMAVDPT
jgi:2-octaprenyl-6-methoxyphenol hydroxylase